MRKLSKITRRHEQVHLTYWVSDENSLSHENISLIMSRGADTDKVFAGFDNAAGFYLEIRYVNPATDEVLVELTHRFSQTTYQALLDAVDGDAENFTVLCQRESLDADEITEEEFILPLKDNRRLDVFIQRFIALTHMMRHNAMDEEYPYDFAINQPTVEA